MKGLYNMQGYLECNLTNIILGVIFVLIVIIFISVATYIEQKDN